MLIGICGKSGTGKTSIVKALEKYGYKRVVTDTTRPPREGEVNEVDYYFDTDEQFDEYLDEGEFIETTSYIVDNGEEWRYGTTKGAIQEAGNKSVIVLNPDGLRAFREQNIPVTVFLIESNETVISSRLHERGDFASEIERRMMADIKDFAGIGELIDFTIFNERNSSIEEIARMINDLVERMEE